jgi:hypothetical protein
VVVSLQHRSGLSIGAATLGVAEVFRAVAHVEANSAIAARTVAVTVMKAVII